MAQVMVLLRLRLRLRFAINTALIEKNWEIWLLFLSFSASPHSIICKSLLIPSNRVIESHRFKRKSSDPPQRRHSLILALKVPFSRHMVTLRFGSTEAHCMDLKLLCSKDRPGISPSDNLCKQRLVGNKFSMVYIVQARSRLIDAIQELVRSIVFFLLFCVPFPSRVPCAMVLFDACVPSPVSSRIATQGDVRLNGLLNG